MSRMLPVRWAVLSVWDKRGIIELAKRLTAAGVELISSGGTAATIEESGVEVTRVADMSGSPEILGGQGQDASPEHPWRDSGRSGEYGSYGRARAAGHRADRSRHRESVPVLGSRGCAGATIEDAIENIDIGGPAMIRAAAKNHEWVGVVTSPDSYDVVAAAVERGGLDRELRASLATEAFAHTASYDAAIARWMQGADPRPPHLILALERARELRYGENPAQDAALYRIAGGDPWWERATQHQGKEMSFNNYADTEAAWRLVNDLPDPAVAIVKHSNPCGVAIRDLIHDAFRAAWECDEVSAFGGIVALNRPLDA